MCICGIFIRFSLIELIYRNASQKAQVSLALSESMLCMDTDNQESIPRNHKLDVTPVTRQVLGVFSQTSGRFFI